jgi:hypothetical protein
VGNRRSLLNRFTGAANKVLRNGASLSISN